MRTVPVKGKKALIYDLLVFLKEDQHLTEPGEIANSMVPGEFPERLLAEAAKAGRARAFSALLQFWLLVADLGPPKGVFACDLFSKRLGRPREAIARNVYTAYVGMTKPTFGKIAQKLIPSEYNVNSKKATDRVRQLYNSHREFLKRKQEMLQDLLSESAIGP